MPTSKKPTKKAAKKPTKKAAKKAARPPARRSGGARAPANHALLIGINAYNDATLLMGAVNDVVSVRDEITRRQQPAPTTLLDIEASRSAIVEQLELMLNRATAGDRVLFYFAGHGTKVEAPAAPFDLHEALCPWDFVDSDPASVITDADLTAILRTRPDLDITVVLDACFAGGFVPPPAPPISAPPLGAVRFEPSRHRHRHANAAPVVSSFAGAVGLARFSACGDGEAALEIQLPTGYRGAFTHHLIERAPKQSLLSDLHAGVTADLRWIPQHPELSANPGAEFL